MSMSRQARGRILCKFYRCDGAVFDVDSRAKETRGYQVQVRACWQQLTREWKSTQVTHVQTLCSGGTKIVSSKDIDSSAVRG